MLNAVIDVVTSFSDKGSCSCSKCLDMYLKWYYEQFSLQKLGCNNYTFQIIAIYNDESQINNNFSFYDFYFAMVNASLSFCLIFIFLCYTFVETIFSIKINTPRTKYPFTLFFNFAISFILSP